MPPSAGKYNKDRTFAFGVIAKQSFKRLLRFARNDNNVPNAKLLKGFTLAEIIAVIVIIGVLASLALPRFTGTIERVRAAEGVEILTALLRAQRAWQVENGTYTTTLANLDVDITRSANFGSPPTINLYAPTPGAPAEVVAEIRRPNAYWLDIDEDGGIGCTDAAPQDFTCAQAGH